MDASPPSDRPAKNHHDTRAGGVTVLSIAIAIAALATSVQAESWETIISHEGQFCIEMPSRPTRTVTSSGSNRGGRYKLVQIDYDRPDGLYLARKYAFSGTIPRNVEEELLDFLRDDLA